MQKNDYYSHNNPIITSLDSGFLTMSSKAHNFCIFYSLFSTITKIYVSFQLQTLYNRVIVIQIQRHYLKYGKIKTVSIKFVKILRFSF